MNNVTNLVQKYRQAPWRVQLQWLGLFLLGVITVAIVAAIYLNVTARAALAGREIQFLESEIENNRRINADLETQLATLTSIENMRQRALALGFEPVEADEVTYMAVAGYYPPAPIDLSTQAAQSEVSAILPEYRQSLFEWLAEQLQASASLTGGQP